MTKGRRGTDDPLLPANFTRKSSDYLPDSEIEPPTSNGPKKGWLRSLKFPGARTRGREILEWDEGGAIVPETEEKYIKQESAMDDDNSSTSSVPFGVDATEPAEDAPIQEKQKKRRLKTKKRKKERDRPTRKEMREAYAKLEARLAKKDLEAESLKTENAKLETKVKELKSALNQKSNHKAAGENEDRSDVVSESSSSGSQSEDKQGGKKLSTIQEDKAFVGAYNDDEIDSMTVSQLKAQVKKSFKRQRDLQNTINEQVSQLTEGATLIESLQNEMDKQLEDWDELQAKLLKADGEIKRLVDKLKLTERRLHAEQESAVIEA